MEQTKLAREIFLNKSTKTLWMFEVCWGLCWTSRRTWRNSAAWFHLNSCCWKFTAIKLITGSAKSNRDVPIYQFQTVYTKRYCQDSNLEKVNHALDFFLDPVLTRISQKSPVHPECISSSLARCLKAPLGLSPKNKTKATLRSRAPGGTNTRSHISSVIISLFIFCFICSLDVPGNEDSMIFQDLNKVRHSLRYAAAVLSMLHTSDHMKQIVTWVNFLISVFFEEKLPKCFRQKL